MEFIETLQTVYKTLFGKKPPLLIPETAIHECKVFECPYCHKVVYLEKTEGKP